MFWTIGAALSHAAFSFVLGRLLAELLVPRSGKLPFACTYFPGNSHIFSLWPLYLLSFFIYTVAFAAIDAALSSRPGKLVWFCVGATLAAQLIVWSRKRVLSAMTALRFDEEDPQAIFQGFQLSEGLAALPRSPDDSPLPRKSAPPCSVTSWPPARRKSKRPADSLHPDALSGKRVIRCRDLLQGSGGNQSFLLIS